MFLDVHISFSTSSTKHTTEQMIILFWAATTNFVEIVLNHRGLVRVRTAPSEFAGQIS